MSELFSNALQNGPLAPGLGSIDAKTLELALQVVASSRRVTETTSLTLPNGRKYVGQTRNGVPHGKGILTYEPSNRPEGYRFGFREEDRCRYEGEFVDGVIQGHGKLWFNKRTYKQPYLNEMESYEGNFSNNLFDGMGIWTRIDKSRYEGSFANGECLGEGKCTYDDGQIGSGRFDDLLLLQGEGKITYPDGTYLQGTFVDGGLHGPGEKTWLTDDHNIAIAKGVFRGGEIWTGTSNGVQYKNGVAPYSCVIL